MTDHILSPIRILLAHHQGKIGGAERSILNLLSLINAERFRFHVMCPAPSPLSEEIEKRGIQVTAARFSRLRDIPAVLRNTRRILQLAGSVGVDILHSNGPQTNVILGLAGRYSHRPVLWHARNILEPEMIDIDRLCARLPTHIVSNSQAIRDRFSNIRSYEQKTSVILNGVDTTLFAPSTDARTQSRSAERIPSDALVVGMFDRLDPRKRHEDVIDACGRLLPRYPNLHVLVSGKAFVNHERRLGELQALAADRGLSDQIRFLGFRRDIPALMAACDVIVLAARHEGCSRTLCEAQAVGIPVVAADDGGNRELIAEGESGFLFPPEDSNALQKHLDILFANQALHRTMGAAARRWAEKHLSIHRYCDQMAELYDALAAHARLNSNF